MHFCVVEQEQSMCQTEKPLVTFSLFAYNQEKYIREAVEAAFAQTYEPLEIILSDDCSTDNTFSIMNMLARAYVGPHKIIVRQTEKNIGTLAHVVDVANISKGAIIVLAAGDDISKPERTKCLVGHWIRTGAWGMCSRFDRIGEGGQIISQGEEVQLLSSSGYRLRQYINDDSEQVDIIHGATSAYNRKLFDYLDIKKHDYILSEDGVLSVLLHLLSKDIVKIDESLVFYRESSESITNAPRTVATIAGLYDDERRIEQMSRSQANRCSLFLRLNNHFKEVKKTMPLNEELLQMDLARHRVRTNWRSMSLLKRINFVISGNCQSNELKWAIPRLVSLPVFIWVKMMLRNIQVGLNLLRRGG